MQTEKAILETLRQRYLNLRKSKNISAYRIGELTGIDSSNLLKYEKGERNFKLESVIKLFEQMGYTLDIKIKPKK